jgi:hypothetical protein
MEIWLYGLAAPSAKHVTVTADRAAIHVLAPAWEEYR